MTGSESERDLGIFLRFVLRDAPPGVIASAWRLFGRPERIWADRAGVGDSEGRLAFLDTTGPHPVLRPDPPPGTSDDDPTSLGAPVDDRKDTRI